MKPIMRDDDDYVMRSDATRDLKYPQKMSILAYQKKVDATLKKTPSELVANAPHGLAWNLQGGGVVPMTKWLATDPAMEVLTDTVFAQHHGVELRERFKKGTYLSSELAVIFAAGRAEGKGGSLGGLGGVGGAAANGTSLGSAAMPVARPGASPELRVTSPLSHFLGSPSPRGSPALRVTDLVERKDTRVADAEAALSQIEASITALQLELGQLARAKLKLNKAPPKAGKDEADDLAMSGSGYPAAAEEDDEVVLRRRASEEDVKRRQEQELDAKIENADSTVSELEQQLESMKVELEKAREDAELARQRQLQASVDLERAKLAEEEKDSLQARQEQRDFVVGQSLSAGETRADLQAKAREVLTLLHEHGASEMELLRPPKDLWERAFAPRRRARAWGPRASTSSSSRRWRHSRAFRRRARTRATSATRCS